MRRYGDIATPGPPLRLTLLLLVFLSATFSGCGDTCVAFISDPSDGTIAFSTFSTSTCSLNNKQTGNVRVRLSSSPLLNANPGLRDVEHVYVSIQGVEVHSSAANHDGSSEWTELLPTLAKHPVQLDLMAQNADSPANNFAGDAAALAVGSYTRMRLVLTSDGSAAEHVTEKNACAATTFNCIVTANGSVFPLAVNSGDSAVLISSASMDGGMFHVFPGTRTDLDLEFTPDSSFILAPASTVWLIPAVAVHSEFSPESGP